MARTEPETPAAPGAADRLANAAEMLLHWTSHPDDPAYRSWFPASRGDLQRELDAYRAEAAALAARPTLDVERLLEDVAARIRSGAYLTYHAGPDNLVRDALDAECARLASLPTDHNHDGGAHCFSDCPAYTRQVHYASLPTEPEELTDD